MGGVVGWLHSDSQFAFQPQVHQTHRTHRTQRIIFADEADALAGLVESTLSDEIPNSQI